MMFKLILVLYSDAPMKDATIFADEEIGDDPDIKKPLLLIVPGLTGSLNASVMLPELRSI